MVKWSLVGAAALALAAAQAATAAQAADGKPIVIGIPIGLSGANSVVAPRWCSRPSSPWRRSTPRAASSAASSS